MNASESRIRMAGVASCLFLVNCYTASRVHAQTACTGEPPPSTTAVPPGTKVYFQLDAMVAALPAGASGYSPQDQIAKAFQAWNTANQKSGSGTDFEPADASHPATVFVTVDPGVFGTGAVTSVPASGTITVLNPATVTLHPNGVLPGGVPAFQPQAPGYDSVYWQVMVHEIAHLMGIGDFPQGKAPPPGPGASALNPLSGVNGTDQSPPTLAPTGCDAAEAKKDQAAITFAGNSGGGGGNSGGGENGPGPGGGAGQGGENGGGTGPWGGGGNGAGPGGSNPGTGQPPPDPPPPDAPSPDPKPCGGSYWDPDSNSIYSWC